ncbi:MAG TPA: DUF1801 domain-containing protein [Allosphingosinicella sp.]|nr:DUF1801 domain-containing protein [Allosphingosinicella sp.]
MAENKTQETAEDVSAFVDKIADEKKRADAHALIGVMERAVGEPARMWGTSIVGFGRYRYKYESGREGEAALAGFSPRAKELVVYLPADAPDKDALLARLGRHRTGTSCLYLKSLADVDEAVLEELVRESAAAIKARYPD